MSLCRSLVKSLIGGLGGSVRGMRRMSEAAFESLDEYDYDTIYRVDGVGVYRGPRLIEAEAWAPNTGIDLHVATTGSDANPGTDPGLPKLTIWSAFNSIPTGNTQPITIWVDSGTYTENWSGGYMLFTKAFAHMVTIRGKPGTLPIIQNASGSYGIRPNGTCANVRFRNLEIRAQAAVLNVVFYNGTNLTNFEFVECTFNDLNSEVTGINFAATSGIQNFAIKRCTMVSAAAYNINCSLGTNSKIIGNNMLGTVVGGVTANTGTYTVNSNKVTGSLAMAGHATTPTTITMRGNECRNIVHTGGATGNRSLLAIERNTVNAGSGIRGIAISGFTQGGTCRNNTVVSLGDTGLGWPIDGGGNGCDGHSIIGNTVTNNGTSGHGILVSTGGSNVIIADNVTDQSGGGSYGIVLKGANNVARNNTFRGGSNSGVLIKDATNCSVIDNVVYSSVVGAIALRFDLAPGSIVTGNTFYVTAGQLHSIANIAAAGTNIVVDNNTYDIDGPATWGAMFGNTVSSLANVRSQWAANYPTAPANDANSVAI